MGGPIALRPLERHLVANFWRQVPPEIAKLPHQVVKLSQDPQFWSQHDPKIAQLGAKLPLRPPKFEDFGANLDLPNPPSINKNDDFFLGYVF